MTLNIVLLGRQPKHYEILFSPHFVLSPFLLTVLQNFFLFLGILTLIIFNILMTLKGGGQRHSAHTFWSIAAKLASPLRREIFLRQAFWSAVAKPASSLQGWDHTFWSAAAKLASPL